METLYLSEVDDEVQNPDLQSLDPPNVSPMAFKDAHKNTLRL